MVTLTSYREMWKLLFLLITAVAASDYDEEHSPGCRSVMYNECEKREESPDFPGSEDELEEFCKFAMKYYGCVANVIDQCHQENEAEAEFIQMLRELIETFTRVCDEDSLLYSALAASLACIKKNNNLMHECHVTMEEGLQTFSEILSNSGITDIQATDTDEPPEDCLEMLYATGCIASRIGKLCGNIAKNAVLDIIRGFDTPFSSCRPGVKDNIPTIVRVMQLEAEKEEDL